MVQKKQRIRERERQKSIETKRSIVESQREREREIG